MRCPLCFLQFYMFDDSDGLVLDKKNALMKGEMPVKTISRANDGLDKTVKRVKQQTESLKAEMSSFIT